MASEMPPKELLALERLPKAPLAPEHGLSLDKSETVKNCKCVFLELVTLSSHTAVTTMSFSPAILHLL